MALPIIAYDASDNPAADLVVAATTVASTFRRMAGPAESEMQLLSHFCDLCIATHLHDWTIYIMAGGSKHGGAARDVAIIGTGGTGIPHLQACQASEREMRQLAAELRRLVTDGLLAPAAHREDVAA
jgi:hypothetical protein